MDAYVHPEDRRVRVSIEASDFSCEGTVHLPGIRLSDVMNEATRFLILVDAVVVSKRLSTAPGAAEPTPARYKTLILRKDQIMYVVPMDDKPRSGF